MSRVVKLRQVFMWIAVTGFLAVLALAHVWQQNTHAGLSRDLVTTARARDVLVAEVLLLETQTRGLRHYSRLETLARERLGLVKPGPAIVIQPQGQVVAAVEVVEGVDNGEDAAGTRGATPIRSARWKGLFR